jgi:type IV pilus biogenesis protein CpaD/CtpE
MMPPGPIKPLVRLTAVIGTVTIGLLAGCAATDPLLNENTWHPIGVNEQNIAAQVANPVDLLHGREPTGGTDGGLAADAILRLRIGHVKALPDSAITDLHVQVAPAASGTP